MGKKTKKVQARIRRRKHIRKTVFGTADKPRISIFRSLKHIYAQAIDDDSGITLASASTVDKELKDTLKGLKKYEAAVKVGEKLGERLKAKSISQAIFDRGGFLYHGRVKALAEGIRDKGIKI